jgi:hypothetical protein
MTKRTTILCNHERHTVEFHDDGTVTSIGRKGGCGDITTQSRRLGTAILLGKRSTAGGCITLAALVNHGIPRFLQRTPDEEGYLDLGNWDPAYTRFESNKVVVSTMKEVRDRRDAAHAGTLEEAFKAFTRCGYEDRDLKLQRRIQFLPDQAMVDGRIVALTQASIWTIPLQHDWLESIYKGGISVVSHKFVCGIDKDDPRHVWAVEHPRPRGGTGVGYVVRSFQLETQPRIKLRSVA